MLLILYIFGVFVVVSSQIMIDLSLTVQTKNGAVLGAANTTVDQQIPYYSYKGIPYAEPPISFLRFEPPVRKKNWNGLLDARREGNICVQPADLLDNEDVLGNEDCLVINVYTPKKPSPHCSLLPTMVWVHGGGFQMGRSTADWYGPDFYMESDVVVVTFNYRLGLFGFLSTGNLIAPGNNGLKDQVMALEWVRDNIKQFCGDPNRVTLAGQSAGAASVAYHMQSPKSRGLFHRVILQSGTSLNLWSLGRQTPSFVRQLAKTLAVDTTSSRIMIDELRNIDAHRLQTVTTKMLKAAILRERNPREGLILSPVSEPRHPGAFFSGKSHDILKRDNFSHVPVLMGLNSMETAFDFGQILRVLLLNYDYDHTRLVPIDMNLPKEKMSEVASKIKKFYFGFVPITVARKKWIFNFLQDDQFLRPIREFGRLLQQRGVPVWMYMFSYEGGLAGVKKRYIPGARHNEELSYHWTSTHQPTSYDDLKTRSRMVLMWTNFIKYGNPTPKSVSILQNVTWPTFGEDLKYLDIGRDLLLKQPLSSEGMSFFDALYLEHGVPPYDTY